MEKYEFIRRLPLAPKQGPLGKYQVILHLGLSETRITRDPPPRSSQVCPQGAYPLCFWETAWNQHATSGLHPRRKRRVPHHVFQEDSQAFPLRQRRVSATVTGPLCRLSPAIPINLLNTPFPGTPWESGSTTSSPGFIPNGRGRSFRRGSGKGVCSSTGRHPSRAKRSAQAAP